MNAQIPSREIRQRLMLTIHQDGLLDILAGLIIATFGTIPLIDRTGMNPGVRSVIFLTTYLVEVLVIMWLKQRITMPRTGVVQLSRKTASPLARTLLVINILLFLLFAGSYFFKFSLWELFGSFQLSVPLGLAFMVPLTAAGILLRAYRFSLYGLLVLGIYMTGEYLYHQGVLGEFGIPVSSFISAGIIITTGVLCLRRFLRTYRVE
jgi:hypothetical protein